MNLFLKKLLGTFTPTDKLEQREDALVADKKRYYEVESSSELAEYNSLKAIVTSADFVAKKQELTRTKYKTTQEYATQRQYKKIIANTSFKHYIAVLESNELAAYLEFRESDEYADLSDKTKVKDSVRLGQMLTFEKSKAYKLYEKYNASPIEHEYVELKERIESAEFQEKDAFWSNPNRWQTTEEYQQEVRLAELEASENIHFYLNVKPARFEEFRSYSQVFADDFVQGVVDMNVWNFGFYYPNEQLMQSHSFANEQQANNGGQNTSVKAGKLTIATRKQTVESSAWDAQKGFMMKSFDYTSDALHTANAFRQKEGVFRAKIRVKGNVNHAFWLSGDAKLPHVNIFHFDGKKIKVGNGTKNGFDHTTVGGIDASEYYIYSLKWTAKEMVWYVNNVEVYRTSNNLPQEPLYISLNSFLPNGQKASEGELNVDWVRVYTIV